MYYSKITSGFYDPNINGVNMPPDAIKITDAEYGALFSAQTGGMLIAPDAAGKPNSVNRAPPTAAQLEQQISGQAKAVLTALRADIFPAVLGFLATLPGAPQTIKNAAILAASESAKVKP